MDTYQLFQRLVIIMGVIFLLHAVWEAHRVRITKDASTLGIYLIILSGFWGVSAVILGVYGVRHGWLRDLSENEAGLIVLAVCFPLWSAAWPISKKLRRRPGWHA